MATYASLTVQQKLDLASADVYYRKFLRMFIRVMREMDSVNSESFVTTVVDPIVASLDVGEVVPNSTGYTGALGLTKAQFSGLEGVVRNWISQVTGNQAVVTKAIGINSDG